MDSLLDFEPVNERICKIEVKLKCYSLKSEHKGEVAKKEFYSSFEEV